VPHACSKYSSPSQAAPEEDAMPLDAERATKSQDKKAEKNDAS
jgi:hypothetical protein